MLLELNEEEKFVILKQVCEYLKTRTQRYYMGDGWVERLPKIKEDKRFIIGDLVAYSSLTATIYEPTIEEADYNISSQIFEVKSLYYDDGRDSHGAYPERPDHYTGWWIKANSIVEHTAMTHHAHEIHFHPLVEYNDIAFHLNR